MAALQRDGGGQDGGEGQELDERPVRRAPGPGAQGGGGRPGAQVDPGVVRRGEGPRGQVRHPAEDREQGGGQQEVIAAFVAFTFKVIGVIGILYEIPLPSKLCAVRFTTCLSGNTQRRKRGAPVGPHGGGGTPLLR